jgi:hypothetical protein
MTRRAKRFFKLKRDIRYFKAFIRARLPIECAKVLADYEYNILMNGDASTKQTVIYPGGPLSGKSFHHNLLKGLNEDKENL